MLNNLPAIRSLRTWRRRVIVGVLILAASAFVARRLSDLPTLGLVESCRVAALDAPPEPAAQLRVAGVCLTAFVWEHDPASGARAARALGRAGVARPLIEALATSIGNRAEGADAWLAVGNVRIDDDDAAGALRAYQQALAHRDDDAGGRLRDTIGLIRSYRMLGDDKNACVAAAAAYDLASGGVSNRDRRATLLNIAELLINLGSLDIAQRLLDEARTITTPADREYAALAGRSGLVEQGNHHPLAARREFLAARAAVRNTPDEWPIHLNLLNLALEQGQIAEARLLVALAPAMPDRAEDRAAAAYYGAQLLVAQGQFLDAARVIAGTPAPAHWGTYFDAVRGHALRLAGAGHDAEDVLLRAVAGIEAQRSALDNDTLKSGMLAQQRAPFEDLFLLYVEQGRTQDALAIVQRATARSVLDGLIDARVDDVAIHDSIVAAGVRADAWRTLARSLRASRSASVPPIATVLARLRGYHVVTYFRAEQALWAIALRRDGTMIARRIAAVDELTRAVTDWLEHPQRDDLAERLGMWLLPDAIAPADDDTLYVIADAPVRDVTFASLRRHGAYVVERNVVGYALSAASLAVAHRPAGTAAAVVVGDPLGDLPSARVEAIEVARTLEVAPYLGRDATHAVVAGAANASVLHIAAHTDSLASGPAIHLADRPLDAATVLETPISAPLVVLLGCSSARAKERDELAPLASAFLAAGARTVVASLWAVDDKIGRDFAREFYRAGGAADPVRALAIAQRRLLLLGVSVDQWSTFVVLGGLRDKLQGELR